jgi:Cu(I)-responsive transcriptional regulator
MNLMNIGEAAAAAAVTPKMIRHYESLGLIPQADRTEAGYRLYGPREVAMLRFIRQARGLGFSMKQIESLLGLWRDERRESREVKALARQQLQELEERQRELDQMKATLAGLVNDCAGDQGSHCAILDRLADAPIATPRAGTDTLKRVRPGSRAKRESPPTAAPRRPEPAHAALAAWSRGLASGAPAIA